MNCIGLLNSSFLVFVKGLLTKNGMANFVLYLLVKVRHQLSYQVMNVEMSAYTKSYTEVL